MKEKLPPLDVEELFKMLTTTMYYKEDNGKVLTLPTNSFLNLREDFCKKHPEEPLYKTMKIMPIPWIANDGYLITVMVVPLDDI